MTVALTGTGGLFTRMGRMGGLLNTINGHVGNIAPNPSSAWGSGGPAIVDLKHAIDNINAQFASANQQLVDGLYSQRDSYRGVHGGMKSYLKSLAQATLIKMVDDDVTLTTYDLPTAIAILIGQMEGVASVPKPTVSASVATVAANGDAVLLASILGPDGLQRDYPFAEVLDVVCNADSQTGGTRYVEQFSVAGDVAQADPLSWDWPKGSGAQTSLTAVDAAIAGPSLLTNGDFENFSVANTPDNWTIAVGVAGTDIFSAGGSDAFTGVNGLRYKGTGGGPLTEIYQAVSLLPSTVYAINCWLKKTTSLAAGVLEIDLHDGTSVIADAQSVDNKITKTLSTLGTSHAPFSGFFRTPAVLPATTRLRIKATTALTSGESMYLDRLAIVPATELYTGGPFAAIFSGATKTVVNDAYTITVANDAMSGAGSGWQKLAERFFGMRALGKQLPSDGSPTLSDALIG